MTGISSHITTLPQQVFSKKLLYAVVLMLALCMNYAFEFQVMNLESEIELVEGEDNPTTEEKSKKEKKEIELIEGSLSSLYSSNRYASNAYDNRLMKDDYIINIQTPPPEFG